MGAEACDEKFRPLKASLSPPKLDCCPIGDCIDGDCIRPKELWRSCCGCGCGFGVEAYNERIDCLRSGREGPDEPRAFPEALEGLSAGAEGGLPKKSRPNNESPCFACGFVGTEAIGGAAREGGPVVLGLTGGFGISPSMSMLGGGFLIGPGC